MNTEKLELIMTEGDKDKRWGVKLADGQNFYKMLLTESSRKKRKRRFLTVLGFHTLPTLFPL